MSDSAPAANRVADALPNSWVYRLLPDRFWPYAQLARWDRPIGWWLLLWPCWWSVVLSEILTSQKMSVEAGQTLQVDLVVFLPGMIWTLVLFMIGAIAMRGAGCTYNDLVDKNLDANVERTASRPIPSGRVTVNGAQIFLLAQALIGFLVLVLLCGDPQYWQGPAGFLLWFNWGGFFLAISSLAIVALYPFAKRVTNWPQFVLGLAFSWGALVGWIIGERVISSPAPFFLYAGCILWVIGYDTIYAHQDKEDDALIGVRSTARLFGEKTKLALIILYSGTLAFFAAAFSVVGTGWPAYAGLAIGCGHMIWQILSLDIDDADNCLRLFKSNGHFGWIVFVGLALDLFL